MNLPIRVFWLLNASVVRLLAEKDLRVFALQASRHGGEYANSLHEHLVEEMGEVGKAKTDSPLEAKRDQAGFDELRNLSILM